MFFSAVSHHPCMDFVCMGSLKERNKRSIFECLPGFPLFIKLRFKAVNAMVKYCISPHIAHTTVWATIILPGFETCKVLQAAAGLVSGWQRHWVKGLWELFISPVREVLLDFQSKSLYKVKIILGKLLCSLTNLSLRNREQNQKHKLT